MIQAHCASCYEKIKMTDHGSVNSILSLPILIQLQTVKLYSASYKYHGTAISQFLVPIAHCKHSRDKVLEFWSFA